MAAGSHHDIPPKSRSLVRYLQEKIHTGQLTHGERIPPLRSFMDLFGLSYGTVKRGIDYLADIGLLEKRTGRGVFVRASADTRTGTGRSLSVCLPANLANVQRGIFPTVFTGIQEACARQQMSLSLHHLDFRALEMDTLERLAERDAGIIFLTEVDRYLTTIDCPCPCVAICSHSTFGGTLSTIDMDPQQAAELAGAYFLERGVDTCVVVTHGTPSYRHRAAVFTRVFSALGGQASIRDEAETLDFAAGTGYLFTTGWVAQNHARRYAERTGGELPHDHVVISFDGKHTLDPLYCSLPAVVAPWTLIGQMAFDDILARLEQPGWPPRRIYVPGVLVDREGCGDPEADGLPFRSRAGEGGSIADHGTRGRGAGPGGRL